MLPTWKQVRNGEEDFMCITTSVLRLHLHSPTQVYTSNDSKEDSLAQGGCSAGQSPQGHPAQCHTPQHLWRCWSVHTFVPVTPELTWKTHLNPAQLSQPAQTADRAGNGLIVTNNQCLTSFKTLQVILISIPAFTPVGHQQNTHISSAYERGNENQPKLKRRLPQCTLRSFSITGTREPTVRVLRASPRKPSRASASPHLKARETPADVALLKYRTLFRNCLK